MNRAATAEILGDLVGESGEWAELDDNGFVDALKKILNLGANEEGENVVGVDGAEAD